VIDGVVGTNTRGAITQFQQSSGISATGRVDAATAAALGVAAETGQSSGGSSRTTTPTTDPNTPPQTENAGFFSNFFNARNPLFWLTLAGVAATVGGTAYYIRKRGKDRAAGLAELSDTGLDRELAMVQAEQEQAAYEAKKLTPAKRRAK
jgi:peptidoglycan hydrolase-like protein with peptidoglycan-binding domain